MRKSNVLEYEGQEEKADTLRELLRKGSEELICRAVEAELQELLSSYSERRTEDDKTAVVRNGYHPERELQTGVGPVTVRIPKVRSRAGKAVTFRSALVAAICEENEIAGSSVAVAVFKGDINGRDE